MEKFINYISFNLIPKHVLMKAPKKKNHINYAIRHRAKSLRTLYLEKSIELICNSCKKQKLFCNTEAYSKTYDHYMYT